MGIYSLDITVRLGVDEVRHSDNLIEHWHPSKKNVNPVAAAKYPPWFPLPSTLLTTLTKESAVSSFHARDTSLEFRHIEWVEHTSIPTENRNSPEFRPSRCPCRRHFYDTLDVNRSRTVVARHFPIIDDKFFQFWTDQNSQRTHTGVQGMDEEARLFALGERLAR